MEKTDAQLVEAFLGGDQSAFGTLVERYKSAVYGLAFHFLRNFVDAEDIAQETFIQAYTNLSSLKEPDKFAGWLRTITHNICISFLRRRKKVISLDEKEISGAVAMDKTEEEYKKKELWQHVERTINSLSEKNQLVITLYYIDGLSYKEIGDFLEIPVNTVKDRLRRAKEQLKEKMLNIVEEGFSERKLAKSFAEKVKTALEERKNITILAISFGEGEAKEITPFLKDVVHKYEGFLAERMENAHIVIFGLPVAHEDDAERAIRTALELREKWESEAPAEFKLKAGICTGLTEVRERKSEGKVYYKPLGNVLDIALELMENEGRILVSESSYRLSKGRFSFREIGEGRPACAPKAFGTDRYEIVDIAEHPCKLWGIDGFKSQMIGRDFELSQLKRTVHELFEDKGKIISIIGEAGFGKSRLVSELKAALTSLSSSNVIAVSRSPERSEGEAKQSRRGEQGVRWLDGRCASYGKQVSYMPFLEILRAYFDIKADDTGEKIIEKIKEKIPPFPPLVKGGRGDFADSLDILPYILRFLSVSFQTKEIENLTAEQLQYKTFIALRTLFRHVAKEQPLVIAIEDLQWIDEASYELLTFLIASAKKAPILFLCVYRPERDELCWQFRKEASKKYPENYDEIALFRLSSEESRLLLRELLQETRFLGENGFLQVEERILEKAGGNPLFLEEIIRGLVDSGKLVRVKDEWELKGEIEEIDVPDTIFSVIMSRIARLDEDTKHALRCASVIGDAFHKRLLREVFEDVQVERSEIPRIGEENIQRLKELDFLVEYEQKSEYTFKHVLIKDVAYSSLLPETRTFLHGKTASAIEGLYGDRLEEFYEVLAYHWRRTDNIEKKIEYLLKAGGKAKRAYSNGDAVNYFEEALKLLDESPLGESRKDWRLEALEGLGQVYFRIRKFTEAETRFREAIALGRGMGLAVPKLVRLYYWLGQVLFWQNRWDERLSISEEGLALLGNETELVEVALMNATAAVSYEHKEDYEKFREFTYRNTQFILRLPYSEELSLAYTHIFIMYANAKNIEEALKWLRSLERKSEQHSDLAALGEVHYYTGLLLAFMGDLHGAVLQEREKLELYTKMGDAKQWDVRLADYFLSLGDLRKAEENALYGGLKRGETIGSKKNVAWGYRIIGTVHLCQGDCEKAVDVLQKAAQLFTGIGERWREAQATCALGRAFLAQGKRQEAVRLFQETIALTKPDFPTLFQSWYWLSVDALSGLEEAYGDTEAFRAFCRRFRQEHPEIIHPLFAQWYLEPTEPLNFPQNLVHDEFINSLTPDWVWQDTFGDCSFTARNGLEMHAANGRDLWYLNLSAPRILKPVSGDFAIQTVCVPPSPPLTGGTQGGKEKPAIGGILLWKDKENFLRFDKGTKGKHEISFSGNIGNKDIIIGRGRLSSESVFLRLERLGSSVNALCSADGMEWFTVGHVDFPVDDPVEAGLHAIGNIDRTIYHGAYPEGTAIRFESFQLWGK